MKYKTLILSTFLLLAGSLQAQETKRVAVSEIPGLGLTYRLPATAMRITVNATRTTVTAGQFAPYAEKYLALTDAPQQDEVRWTLNSVDMQPVAVPDTSRIYHITFREKDNLPTFYLNNDGYLTAINRQPEVVAPVVDAAPAPAAEPAKLSLRATDVLNEEILKATSRAKQAELTAREIFGLRESVRDLVKGDVDNMPADGASLQIMVDHLKAEEQALLSLFVGSSQQETVVKTFDILPDQEIDGQVVFRFSKHFGIVDADDLSGNPYTLDVRILEDQRINILSMDPKAFAKMKSQTGIAYCMPGRAHVALSHDGKILSEGDFQMGQLGHVEQLPVGQFTDKKKMTSAAFDPLSGSIRLFETEVEK